MTSIKDTEGPLKILFMYRFEYLNLNGNFEDDLSPEMICTWEAKASAKPGGKPPGKAEDESPDGIADELEVVRSPFGMDEEEAVDEVAE